MIIFVDAEQQKSHGVAIGFYGIIIDFALFIYSCAYKNAFEATWKSISNKLNEKIHQSQVSKTSIYKFHISIHYIIYEQIDGQIDRYMVRMLHEISYHNNDDDDDDVDYNEHLWTNIAKYTSLDKCVRETVIVQICMLLLLHKCTRQFIDKLCRRVHIIIIIFCAVQFIYLYYSVVDVVCLFTMRIFMPMVYFLESRQPNNNNNTRVHIYMYNAL